MNGFVAVGVGAILGAWLRWGLGLWLNPVYPALPMGTLTANLIGGYVIGLALAFFLQHPGLPPEWRLFFITGFLGALTTFSTFSAEVVTMLSRTQYLLALGTIALHVLGSLAATGLGIWTIKLMRG
ncbi:MAG TPA: fluoride efflux transporter CrcB [Thiobacillaceae bacterium]|nr:fluoride efflux transporter CrcB [Thiobacillaceae bacterium]